MCRIDQESIELLDLSVRSYRYCKNYGIHTIQELKALSNEELFIHVALGSKKVFQEINNSLQLLTQKESKGVKS